MNNDSTTNENGITRFNYNCEPYNLVEVLKKGFKEPKKTNDKQKDKNGKKG